MTDEELLDGFARGTLETLPHRDHVRLAWLYLEREPLLAALPRFCADLRHFADKAGAPQKYHETVTWAYMLLVNERRHARRADDGWPAFARENEDLLSWRPSILDRYYEPATLESDRARRTFVLPDRLCP